MCTETHAFTSTCLFVGTSDTLSFDDYLVPEHHLWLFPHKRNIFSTTKPLLLNSLYTMSVKYIEPFSYYQHA